MRLPLVLAALFFASFVVNAADASEDFYGTGTGRDGAISVDTTTVVNAYVAATGGSISAGSTSVEVADSSGFAAGDLALILQPQDLTGLNSGAHPSGVELVDSAAGQFEFARVASTSAGQLSLVDPLVNDYDAANTQVVRVPEYTDVSISAPGAVVATPWDGRTGGIVAFLASGTVTNEGTISADGAGFRGAATFGRSPVRGGCTDPNQPHADGQYRGEGIDPSLWRTSGPANALNGGGGANCFNAGGGGGGHAGMGGDGGRTWEADGERDQGGRGGDATIYSALQRITFGGGGGAGHGNNGQSTDGGNGGGAIFVRAARIKGSGDFSSDGEQAATSGIDGAGGGGAGGLIIARVVSTVDCASAHAVGGDGGSSTGDRYGTGGGGAGGKIIIQSAGGACATSVASGIAGQQTDPGAVGGLAHGATPPNSSSPDSVGQVEAPPAGGLVIDQDGDGLLDVFEGGTDSDGDGTPDYLDPDDDGDGVPTRDENSDPNGDGNPDDALDSDGDNVPDFRDSDSNPTAMVAIDQPIDGELTNDSTPVLTGTATPGQTVTLTIDGVEVGTVLADPITGAWSFMLSMSLTDGTHQIEAVVAFGSQGASDVHDVTIDSTAPVVTVVVMTPTADTTPPISGTVDEPGASVSVSIDGATAVLVSADSDGNWTYTPTNPLAAGSHDVSVSSVDDAGNVGTATATFFVNPNECTDGTATCDTNATCADTMSGFTCTCNAGFVGDGNTCQAEGCACGADEVCVSGACYQSCGEDADCTNPSELCFDARCVSDPCDGITCGAQEACFGGSCFLECGDSADCTNPDDLCFDGRCAPDACAGVSCSSSQTCWGGSCFDTCEGDVDCNNPGDRCYESRCTADPCNGVACATGEACWGGSCFQTCSEDVDCSNPADACYDGRCTDEACRDIMCPGDEACWGGSCFQTCSDEVDCSNPADSCYDGRCTDDACRDVACPSSQSCWGGSCFSSCGGDVDCGQTDHACYESRCATDPCDGVQCPLEQECVAGYCRTECTTDQECGAGEVCELGLCESPATVTPPVSDDGCGCASSASGANNAWLAILGLVGMISLTRTRRRF